ncbi:MAG: hypothetical protein V4563_15005 [Pseudomonadota bacterium]
MSISTRKELSMLAAVSGPQQTRAEAETEKLLQEWKEVNAQVAAVPQDVRMERCAAVLSGMVSAADAEAVRAAYWNRTRLAARRVAVMAGGLPKERADDALAKFDALERGRIHLEIEKLIADLRQIQKCMNGGHVTTGNPVH